MLFLLCAISTVVLKQKAAANNFLICMSLKNIFIIGIKLYWCSLNARYVNNLVFICCKTESISIYYFCFFTISKQLCSPFWPWIFQNTGLSFFAEQAHIFHLSFFQAA